MKFIFICLFIIYKRQTAILKYQNKFKFKVNRYNNSMYNNTNTQKKNRTYGKTQHNNIN